jgi:serine/threonine-protein kinase
MTSDPVMERLREATADQFEILRELGRGGMAAVYLAYEIALDRYVAIKVLIADPDGDGEASRRFLQEARTAARLSHPNVVRVFAVAPEGASVRYFTMQYVDGCSLDDLLRASGPLPIPVACHILAQVVAGLRYAHGHDRGGVVHRDVKPANVMLDGDGRVVLTDFGIARIAGTDGVPDDVGLFGTPEYMSPEQWRDGAITPASDQFSLGAVAYRMLAGAAPLPLGSPPRPLRTVREDCPPRLAAVVERMLERSPDARYPSLDEVYRELLPLVPAPESVTELRELVARAAHAAAHAAASTGPPLAASVESTARPEGAAERAVDPTVQLPPLPPLRRRRALLAVGGVAIAAGGLGALLALARHPRPPAAAPRGLARRDSALAAPVQVVALPSPSPLSAAAAGETVASGAPTGREPGRAAPPRRAPAASRRPARVAVVGLPADGRLREGDSVRVRATVLDGRGARLAAAPVDLASSDSARVAVRKHGGSQYVVARAARGGGAPVRITARSGGAVARRSVTVVGRGPLGDAGSEAAHGPSDSVARPREAAVDAALDSVLAGLSANRRELFGRLRPADGDSASAIRFLEWAAGVRRLRVRGASRERPVVTRDGATVDFAVELTWHRGLRRDPVRTARLRATFVPDGRGWRLDRLQLREPFSPR